MEIKKVDAIKTDSFLNSGSEVMNNFETVQALSRHCPGR
jgi:hypothetical protein